MGLGSPDRLIFCIRIKLRNIPGKVGMQEVETIAPIASSPLDACRGRGKGRITGPLRIKSVPAHDRKKCPDCPSIVIVLSLEPIYTVGKVYHAK